MIAIIINLDTNGQLMNGIVNNFGGNEPTQLRYYYGGIDPMVHSMRNAIRFLADRSQPAIISVADVSTTAVTIPPPPPPEQLIQHEEVKKNQQLARGRL
jgi:hypothetical protein